MWACHGLSDIWRRRRRCRRRLVTRYRRVLPVIAVVYTPAVVPTVAKILLIAPTQHVVEPDNSSTGSVSVADHSAHVTAVQTSPLSTRIAKLDVYTEYLTFYVSAAYAAPEALFYRVRHGFCPVCCLVPNIFLSLCKNSEPVSMKFAAGHHCYEHLNDYISAETGTRTT